MVRVEDAAFARLFYYSCQTARPMKPSSCVRLLLAVGVLPLTVLGQKIEIQWDHDTDFSQYRTFAMRPGFLNSRNPALNSDLVRHDLEDAIRKNLSSRGMKEVAETADLNVRFSLGRVNRIVARHGDGTLVIDLRDPQKRDVVWRGIAVDEKRGLRKVERNLESMVRRAIEKYPPKAY
jgi:Domain of unknown function (DUF4136)